VVLLVLSASMAVQVREKLAGLGFNVNVCVANHPLAVETDTPVFHPVSICQPHSPVVLLGLQYQRMAWTCKLKTSRRLPGFAIMEEVTDSERRDAELEAEGVDLDDTVEVKRLGTY
jgi:hypothetical protein